MPTSISQPNSRLTSPHSHSRSFTLISSLRIDEHFLNTCADRNAFGHREACAARDGWRFTPEVSVLPHGHPAFTGDPTAVSYAEQDERNYEKPEKQSRSSSRDRKTLREVIGQLRTSLSRECPERVRWTAWANRLQARLDDITARHYGGNVPKLTELVDALRDWSILAVSLWHEAALEATELWSELATESTNYRRYLKRLICSIEKFPRPLTLTLHRELLGAKVLDFSSMLANKHGDIADRLLQEDAASRFAGRTFKYIMSKNYDGRDINGAMARDFRDFFSTTFLRDSNTEGNVALNEALAEDNSLSIISEDDGDDEYASNFSDSLMAQAIPTSSARCENAAKRIAEVWPAMSSVEQSVALAVLEGETVKDAGLAAGISESAARKMLRRIPSNDGESSRNITLDLQAAADDGSQPLPTFAELAARAGVSLDLAVSL